ncbi:MAG: SPOR domain-containing protein [Bacteroidia bacterium]|nr:SPOR domain-containing protein [Bacteroidia bacterium]
MKLLSILLAGVMSMQVPSGDGDDKKKSKGKEFYYKYEREEVSDYRDRVEFKMPEPKVIAVQITEETPHGMSLSYLFSPGKKLHIEADAQLESLIQKHIEINAGTHQVSGFRIQVFAGSNRQNAWSSKGTAMSRFSQLPQYLEYEAPNYVVRVGDFMDKEDAILMLRAMREVFPGAFIVPDMVKVPRVLPEEEETDEFENNTQGKG